MPSSLNTENPVRKQHYTPYRTSCAALRVLSWCAGGGNHSVGPIAKHGRWRSLTIRSNIQQVTVSPEQSNARDGQVVRGPGRGCLSPLTERFAGSDPSCNGSRAEARQCARISRESPKRCALQLISGPNSLDSVSFHGLPSSLPLAAAAQVPACHPFAASRPYGPT